MSLSAECIQYLNEEYDRLKQRRGSEYHRFYGMLTATMEYILEILDDAEWVEDEDYGWDGETPMSFSAALGVDGATKAEDWAMSGENISQVLDELSECDTKEKFYAKFSADCSLAWLFFWSVKFWDEYYPPFLYLRKVDEDRCPQWMLEELKDYEEG